MWLLQDNQQPIIMAGKPVAAALNDALKERVARLNAAGVTPGLTAVLVGEDDASQIYVRNKARACERLGLSGQVIRLPDTTAETELLDVVAELNADRTVHGILVQLPLSKQIDEHKVIAAIDPDKDVDGFHPVSVGNLVLEMPGFVSCTPAGILEMLKFYEIETSGKHTVVVGRSNIVGKPMANLLMRKDRTGNATVTVCNSRTPDIGKFTREADIVIAAIGKAHFITGEMLKPGAVVIDVGINRIPDSSTEKGYRVVGDVDYDSALPVVSAITPVPGGVGRMTIAMLMHNTVLSAEKSSGVNDV
ncbi:MAG: bifunctional methylenetetrahydrofolate dehydrogenase/methenyltetrahydrofolate cyclohydrolase FolD [Lentisphaeria bacterium]|nr:bifunctional methylenetetrahydrofolate dehydrogenase/methenyltetrahydrofolate cyclohydrolase FolD [Candidatus Neomarinimicrobiota bacterium]MCF7842684.1 bifunctional methylenetetrahydrofolate dehydrogenase/methenyltetrahydrofolate cyclohydrolase FolD [Lentisphaeria bacterium]